MLCRKINSNLSLMSMSCDLASFSLSCRYVSLSRRCSFSTLWMYVVRSIVTGPRFLSLSRMMMFLLFFSLWRFCLCILLRLQWGLVVRRFCCTRLLIFSLKVDNIFSSSLQPGSGCHVDRK